MTLMEGVKELMRRTEDAGQRLNDDGRMRKMRRFGTFVFAEHDGQLYVLTSSVEVKPVVTNGGAHDNPTA